MTEQQAAQTVQAERFSLRVIHAIMRADLSVTHKHLLNLICYHHNDERGYAWPSVERLALMAGNVDPRTIQRQLRALQKRGLIDIQPMPGMRTNAYLLQEQAIAAIAISNITWPKNVLGHPTFACATPDTSVALPRHQSAPTPALECSYPDTGATLTEEERKIGTEKRNGGGTDARATPPAPAAAPAPAAPAAPEPAPSPAIFASQPPQPEQPTAPADDATAFAQLVDRINAQRASNGKPSALTLADLHQLHIEAAKAGITPMQAAEWVLKSKGRNFFKADYFAPPAPAPVAPATPAQPAPQPAPAPVLTPEQSAEQEAAAAAAKAKLKAMFAQPASTATPAQAQAADTLTVGKTGHAWADSAIAEALAGEPVGVRRLEMACQIAKVSYSEVRAAQKRAAATVTA